MRYGTGITQQQLGKDEVCAINQSLRVCLLELSVGDEVELRGLPVDDGSGQALYAAGRFTTAGGQTANSIARWDGSAWSPLGSGLSGTVRALTGFSDGSAPALYPGGEFSIAGGNASAYMAKWQGCPTGSACPPDLNADGLLNFFDIAAFIAAYNAGCP